MWKLLSSCDLIFSWLWHLSLFHLDSVFLLKEVNCFILVYSMCLAYLSAPSALPRNPISRPTEHNIYVHAKDANIRIVLCPRYVNVLMYSKRNVTIIIER